MSEIRLINGDCLKVLPDLPKATMIFADPPDNLGCKYKGFTDRWETEDAYKMWLMLLNGYICHRSQIGWLSFNSKWLNEFQIPKTDFGDGDLINHRLFIWRYTFGQYRKTDCGSGYRPILRFMRAGAKLYPDAIRVPSARQLKYNDKRAHPAGRVPDDVWDFPRVCGTFKERKKWHPCQHPKELLKRMVLFSTKPGDLVIDLCAGSGNMLEVCRELERDCIGIEISSYYCSKIAEEQKIEVEKMISYLRVEI